MRFFKWLLERNLTYEEALEIFGITKQQAQDKDFLNKQWKKLALQHHPDKGGSVEMMQKINAAYDILKGKTSGSRSEEPTSAQRQEYEKKKKEWEERERKWYEYRKEMKSILEKKFDLNKFIKHFEKISGKDFEAEVRWDNIEKSSMVGAKVIFESSDMQTTITFQFHAQQTNDMGSFDSVGITREVFHNNKSYKVGKEKYQRFSLDALSQPSKLFPKQRMNTIMFGSKTSSFKKKDMLSFMEKKLKANISQSGGDVTARIPVGDDYTLILYRMTMMRQGSWGINGLYRKHKRIHSGPMITAIENKEAAEFFEYLVNEMKRSNTEATKIAIMDRIVSQYKKQKGM